MSKPRSCYCGKPRCAGGQFPDCGCAYTTKDDGVHFCPLHAAAPDLLKACQAVARGTFYLTDAEFHHLRTTIARATTGG